MAREKPIDANENTNNIVLFLSAYDDLILSVQNLINL